MCSVVGPAQSLVLDNFRVFCIFETILVYSSFGLITAFQHFNFVRDMQCGCMRVWRWLVRFFRCMFSCATSGHGKALYFSLSVKGMSVVFIFVLGGLGLAVEIIANIYICNFCCLLNSVRC